MYGAAAGYRQRPCYRSYRRSVLSHHRLHRDGLKWAADSGHRLTELSPALVPFEVKETETVKELQGLSLKNIEAAVYDGKKELYREFGEMLFTHFGVSGLCS